MEGEENLMKANETKLQPILEGTKQYVVPLFQRSYSWKIKHWKMLWDDLADLYLSDDGREHFLGAIVSMPTDMSPEGVNKYLLIDGQQRMTTIFVLLAAIRDLSKESDQRLAEQINELYLFNKWEEGRNRNKLLPSQADRIVFAKIIGGKSLEHIDSDIEKAYVFYQRMLIKGFENDGTIDLRRLLTLLMQRIVMVSIVLDKDENPYLIFESLNAKGEPLTQADLVRNYILMRIADEHEQEIAYRDFWLPIQRTLENELTNFLWRYLLKDGTFIRQNAIYDTIKWKLSKLSPKQVIDFLVDLHTYSTYYLKLFSPEKETNTVISQKLVRLNRWEVKTAYPFLLNLYHDYQRNKISSDDFCQILDNVESFVVRRFFCRYPTSTLNKIFIALYNTIDLDKYVESLNEELIRRQWPSTAEFLEGWKRFPIYTSGTSKCRHILENLEATLTDNNEPVDITHPKITIEHVMPQTLNEAWERMLGEQASNTHEVYKHTIGNLTLTGMNSPMGNAPFPEKQITLAKSNFALNKAFSGLTNWDETEILERANALGRLAVQIWTHPGGDEVSGDEPVKSAVDPTGYKPTGFSLYGNNYFVESWREMLLQALSLIAKKYGEQFTRNTLLINSGRRTHIAPKSDGMITPIIIPGTELFVEANQSSRSVLRVIQQTLINCGDNVEVFEAYW